MSRILTVISEGPLETQLWGAPRKVTFTNMVSPTLSFLSSSGSFPNYSLKFWHRETPGLPCYHPPWTLHTAFHIGSVSALQVQVCTLVQNPSLLFPDFSAKHFKFSTTETKFNIFLLNARNSPFLSLARLAFGKPLQTLPICNHAQPASSPLSTRSPYPVIL